MEWVYANYRLWDDDYSAFSTSDKQHTMFTASLIEYYSGGMTSDSIGTQIMALASKKDTKAVGTYSIYNVFAPAVLRMARGIVVVKGLIS